MMYHINFLPWRSMRHQRIKQRWIIGLISMLLLHSALYIVIYSYMHVQSTQMRTKIRQIQARQQYHAENTRKYHKKKLEKQTLIDKLTTMHDHINMTQTALNFLQFLSMHRDYTLLSLEQEKSTVIFTIAANQPSALALLAKKWQPLNHKSRIQLINIKQAQVNHHPQSISTFRGAW